MVRVLGAGAARARLLRTHRKPKVDPARQVQRPGVQPRGTRFGAVRAVLILAQVALVGCGPAGSASDAVVRVEDARGDVHGDSGTPATGTDLVAVELERTTDELRARFFFAEDVEAALRDDDAYARISSIRFWTDEGGNDPDYMLYVGRTRIVREPDQFWIAFCDHTAFCPKDRGELEEASSISLHGDVLTIAVSLTALPRELLGSFQWAAEVGSNRTPNREKVWWDAVPDRSPSEEHHAIDERAGFPLN